VSASNDILMVLVKSGSSGIAADSMAALGSADPMLTGPPKFEKGKFFELENFSLALMAQPHDADDDNKKQGPINIHVGNKSTSSSGERFGRNVKWLPANLNPISCTRQLDSASPVLFEDCGKGTPYLQAAIVRRKVVGGGMQNLDANSHLMSYVRLDFTDVVITNLSWSNDDDGIKESFQFVCAKAEVHFRQQSQTGTVTSKQLPPGIWQK
jgi:type VI protein secretion system component Hcp